MCDHSVSLIPDTLQKLFDNSSIALSLADAGQDKPLIAINTPFCNLTGYTKNEIIGRNCRFLQKNADNTIARKELRDFLDNKGDLSIRKVLINFKSDGTPLINLLYMSRLCDSKGNTRFILASQFEISNSYPETFANYGIELQSTVQKITPAVAQAGIILEGSIRAIANSTSMIAQAKLTLEELKNSGPVF